MDEKMLEYAKLVVRVGANIQNKQTLLISSPVECAYFVRMLAKEAYEAGCREVVTRWTDDEMTKLLYLKGDDSVFDKYPSWNKLMYDELAAEKAAIISIYATDPELLADVDPDRVKRSQITSGKALKDFSDKQMANEFQWCVVSLPTASWAKKVYPELSASDAVEKLWDAIYHTVRIGEGKSAVELWNEHLAALAGRVDKLNGYAFDRLIYKNSLGTDLTVELPDNHCWIAGDETSKSGVKFVANMPTEEIFTLPKRGGVNGTLVASKPLSISGKLVENFKFIFKNGKITEAYADKGLDVLKNALSVDEGASYLGEVALVPYESPISKLGVLFFNGLYDENAACHFAFGAAYPCFSDAAEISKETMAQRGMNDSITHEDFMVGTPDLSITGVTKDGREIAVFVNGNFAF